MQLDLDRNRVDQIMDRVLQDDELRAVLERKVKALQTADT